MPLPNFSKNRYKVSNRLRAFTLVEIMLVVVLIGLLAAIAIPGYQKARANSLASSLANDFRVFAYAFEVHNIKTGEWAPDGMGNQVAADVEPYLKGTSWKRPAANRGTWDWERGRHDVDAAVGLTATAGELEDVFKRVDEILEDDGSLSTGRFRFVSDRYIYILAF